MPTLHWKAYCHYTNPLSIPLTNTHEVKERSKNILYRLTTLLTPRHFTYVGFLKILKTLAAPRANEFPSNTTTTTSYALTKITF